MNILYINHYAGSPKYGMEYRPYYMSKEWLKSGHNVTILASSYSHVRNLQPDVTTVKTLENIDGINYIWYKTPTYSSNGFGRVKNICSFLFNVWIDRNQLVKELRPDVVIASSTYPMDIWVAKAIAHKANAKLIFEVHDLWPLSPIELGGMSPYHPFIQWCQWAENTAYKYSDAVVSMLPNVHKHMEEHGLDLSKLHIIPNGIVEEDWLTENIHSLSNGDIKSFFDVQKELGNTIVAYTGAHGQPNALELLLESAKYLSNEKIVFMFVGAGLEKSKLLARKNEENINNVYFFNPINKKEIPNLLKNIDIAYIGLQNQSLFRFGISPNKLMDYMMAAKPIVCAINAGNDPVTEVNCGITVKSNNSNEIAKAILTLAQLPISEREQMGLNGYNHIIKEHTYSKLAKKFLEVMNNE
ncbi:glycosyltransferase family 4 protein [Glaesserella parasuis]|uniref:UDP-N-acetylglucosamine 2-epimerase n=1 Tax=Glaesserella parasuis TaxID=738 RepID=T1RQ28_GLAPU|nr:glycosyltransferase family 4 protein [Glaesserella parasuis]AGM38866.1 UDP-N-acetylglucosamine 2-epimerase [Glaesserella parasuis]MCT8546225.1 glycosyltransferase family 4 protein [Glaesserella parasuis]MCT8551477.1 glycosyltransferase family 4 protein [Glaesserella parasuis]MDD2155482.1 glycosyltransferase family 4 protein [Glaesserella parasuis]MDG6296198.1 glycosyltransferase family 4 protein [Glaesserella parasuis]